MTAIRIPFARTKLNKRTLKALLRPVPIAPLIVIRVLFGLMMFASMIRFMWRGWITEFYVLPQFHFTYLGFNWIQPFPPAGMWFIFITLAILAILITLGLFYRPAIILFFLFFTYVELIDKTFYLNHYYFVSLFSFLLIWMPLNQNFSLDCQFKLETPLSSVPAWMVYTLQIQIGLVYFFAGIAKINGDWIVNAMPLAVWLPANASLPIIGPLFDFLWVAYVMSWAGLLFDLTIPFWLFWKRSRPYAYIAVVVFHIFTAVLFNIGMFPWIMIGITLVFFKWRNFWEQSNNSKENTSQTTFHYQKPLIGVLILFFCFQFIMPMRHLMYPGNVLWTEEGYRFSWRVMLAEKTGYVTYFIVDEETGEQETVSPSEFLTHQQVRQMSFQPDMILQFAHFLATQYENPVSISAEAYVSWNGRSSQLLIDPTINLVEQPYSIQSRNWILAEGH